MADTKISDMTAASTLASSVIPIVQGGANKKAADTLFLKSGVTNTLTANTAIQGNYSQNFTSQSGNIYGQVLITQGVVNVYSQNVDDENEYSRVLVNGQVFRVEAYTSPTAYSKVRADGNQLILEIAGAGARLTITGLPTSASGLTSGMVWNDSGTLKIVT
jgi:hypothetical protein